MQKFRLASGSEIPSVGLGTWKITPEEVFHVVKSAIKHGYRHIDCAAAYLNQEQIGKALKEAIKENNIKREDVFITSKLWNTHHSKEHVRKACEVILKELQLEYLDLLLMHWPIAFQFNSLTLNKWDEDAVPKDERGKAKLAKISIQETWREMEALVDAGLVKNIGVSNMTIPQLHDLLSYSRIKPVVNQVELHPYLAQQTLVDYCKEEGIIVTSYSTLGSGSKQSPLYDPVVNEIARQKGKTPAQVLLRWCVQRGINVIPKV